MYNIHMDAIMVVLLGRLLTYLKISRKN